MTDDACLSVENAKLLERVEEWFRAERKHGTTWWSGWSCCFGHVASKM